MGRNRGAGYDSFDVRHALLLISTPGREKYGIMVSIYKLAPAADQRTEFSCLDDMS